MAPLIFSAVLFCRIVDAVADPLIARWSDNYSSNGAGESFMAISGFFMPLSLSFFYPVVPKESPGISFIW